MGSDILVHLDDLTRDLARYPVRKRIAFAAWCCEALFRSSYSFLEERLDKSLPRELRGVLNEVWASLVSNRELDVTRLLRLRSRLELVDWSEDILPTDSESQEDAAIQCLECAVRLCDIAETGSAKAGAEAAERVINHLDFRLGQGPGTFDDPLMKAEIEAQRKMIRWLGSTEEITLAARNLFRELSL